MCGKISVTDFPQIKRIPNFRICRWVQGPAIRETFHEVRVTYKRPAKRNQVRMTALERGFCCSLSVPAISYQGALKHGPEFRKGHGRSKLVKTKSKPIYYVQIRKAVLVKLFCDMEKSLAEIRRPHVVEIAVR